jgi:hypothetical protein
VSANSVPYHLRTNKTIDRDIFLDLLSRLKLSSPIQEYEYVSLGGPMLEDFKLIHYRLELSKLSSIEKDPSVITRQEFNKPFNCISCIQTTTKTFIDDFTAVNPSIFWLDYTTTQWRSQFEECRTLISKLNFHDIFKVTLNANPDCLGNQNDGDEKIIENFKNKASSSYTSENIRINDLKALDRFANVITKVIQNVAESALKHSDDLFFEPLTIFRYKDGPHQMLSITGIVLKNLHENPRTKLLQDAMTTDWPHISKSWTDIHEIAVPDLTGREKLSINRLLPSTTGNIKQEEIPFQLDKNPAKNMKSISNYIKYYRYIPNFERLVY